MMLICMNCGNTTYFVNDVQIVKSVTLTQEGIMIEDVVLNGSNWSDSTIFDELNDNVDYVEKQSLEILQFDNFSGHYENTMITCGRCESKRVTPPYSRWRPRRQFRRVDEEIMHNRQEYKKLRKEKMYHADNLPVLWKP